MGSIHTTPHHTPHRIPYQTTPHHTHHTTPHYTHDTHHTTLHHTTPHHTHHTTPYTLHTIPYHTISHTPRIPHRQVGWIRSLPSHAGCNFHGCDRCHVPSPRYPEWRVGKIAFTPTFILNALGSLLRGKLRTNTQLPLSITSSPISPHSPYL